MKIVWFFVLVSLLGWMASIANDLDGLKRFGSRFWKYMIPAAIIIATLIYFL